METLARAAVEKAATTKAVKGATKDLEPGLYLIDTVVSIKGTITKGEGYEEHMSNSVNWRGVFVRSMLDRGLIRLVRVPGKKLPRLRFRDKASRKIWVDLIRAIDEGEDEARKEEQKQAEALLGRWFAKVMDKTLKTHTGKTTASLSVEAVTHEPVAVASDAAVRSEA